MDVDDALVASTRRPVSDRTVAIPGADGVAYRVQLEGPPESLPSATTAGPHARTFFAAPHVVADPTLEHNGSVTAIDWDRSLAFREHLWNLGLGVAEAMDTAQRGMGLDWPAARELITLVGRQANGRPVAAGASTDQLESAGAATLDEIERAYIEQCQVIQAAGVTPVIMASRSLAMTAQTSADYTRVYERVLDQVDGPVMLHWLGDAFDPQLSGYWGSTELDVATDALIEIVGLSPEKIIGVKISILDAARERILRTRMPAGVRIYTGDDFNYVDLIRGDELGHSDALLGVFNPLARQASAALHALDNADLPAYDAALYPTVPLARHLFEAPTQFYKTGVVFLAYLNGHQDHFHMLGGFESARTVLHLAEIVRLASLAGALEDPDLAAHRARLVLADLGVAQ